MPATPEMTANRFFLPVLMLSMLASSGAQCQPATAAFVPELVFAGGSEGKGELWLMLVKKRPFTVESLGTRQANGYLRLTQRVRFEGKAEHSRTWVMWQTSPGYYSATLTDAAGPVFGRTQGSRMTLRYPLNRWGLVMHQTLDLAADRHTIANTGSIRFLGIPIGKLRETIQLKY